MLNHIKVTNDKLKTAGGSKKYILASPDVKALYPSLNMGQSAEIVRKAVENSEVEIAGVE